jgi:phage antirepressor YoqD-like protein
MGVKMKDFTNIIQLNIKAGQKMMSSTEIAELTGKEKNAVHRDIRTMLVSLYGGKALDELIPEKYKNRPSEYIRDNCRDLFKMFFEDDSATAPLGKSGVRWEVDYRGYVSDFFLNHEHTLTLITGYEIKARHTINKRWLELEEERKLPSNYVEALECLIASEKEKENAYLKIEQQNKKLENKDALILASNEASIKAGEILIRQFVKEQDLIDMGQNQFFKWMDDQNITFGPNHEPYQKYIKLGYFTYKPSVEEYGGKVRHQIRVTPRGKAWLACKYIAWLDSGADQPENDEQ